MEVTIMGKRYTTIENEDGQSVTGVEVDRTSHVGSDLFALIITGGLRAFGAPTPDTVVVQTPDGRLHKSSEK
ncbi:hypothetical protein [Bradyrhizobium sp. SZCCHNS3055]|uniref:hypothetical protein n=1 Tax=Bradyrhizobium sp. SZCCHNS3055 TaxID=3057323 RepID=UPI0028EF96EB|nr:hypothetical protein [Bradyrhizobium sp. SZCCHNS3055]